MKRHERIELAMAELELHNAIAAFNNAAEHLNAAGYITTGSDATRAVARCADLAATVGDRLAADISEQLAPVAA